MTAFEIAGRRIGPDQPVFGLSLPPDLVDPDLAGDVEAAARLYLVRSVTDVVTGPTGL